MTNIFKTLLEANELEQWQAQVKKAYPEHASKLKFKSRLEKGKDLISAEVPGLDRCFGVFDMETLKGEVIGE